MTTTVTIKTTKRRKADPFFCGAASALAFMCIVQEYMGLEGYIQHLRNNWFETPIIIPILIFLVFFVLGFLNRD